MFSSPFVCMFVSRITQKLTVRLRQNFVGSEGKNIAIIHWILGKIWIIIWIWYLKKLPYWQCTTHARSVNLWCIGTLWKHLKIEIYNFNNSYTIPYTVLMLFVLIRKIRVTLEVTGCNALAGSVLCECHCSDEYYYINFYSSLQSVLYRTVTSVQ